MKFLLMTFAVLLIAVSWVFAAYISIWFMLIGGIIQIVHAVQCDPVTGSDLAIGIVKVVFFNLGWIIGAIGTTIGVGIMAVASESLD